MSPTAYLLALLGYGVMYALPYIFFQRKGGLGRFNLRWWLTGAPFAIGAVAIMLAWAQELPFHALVSPTSDLAYALDLIAVPLIAASIAMVAATIAVHKVPLALWHQADDAPVSIVTYGPYRYVRHPFYVSFILLLVGTALLTREAIGLGALAAGITVLGWTARREEQRLLASSFGDEYAAYLARTGRFVPRLGMR
ncbi:MAG TPA: isoprenylcysteine carboxylmethyltransferase family protein [Kofleriaceae bacterium]|nr:isoprenylcysteine carboxylmethyltransferase family protein [Kofleriaceae bacterium]